MLPASSPEEPQSTSSRRLLIIEDEISTIFAMREFFSFQGYHVDCAAGATDAIVLLDRGSYDVVITDLHLTPLRCAEGMDVLMAIALAAHHATSKHLSTPQSPLTCRKPLLRIVLI